MTRKLHPEIEHNRGDFGTRRELKTTTHRELQEVSTWPSMLVNKHDVRVLRFVFHLLNAMTWCTVFAAFIYLIVWRMIQIHHVPCCWLTIFTAQPKTIFIPNWILITTTFLPLQKIHKLARAPNLPRCFKSHNHHLRPSPYSFIPPPAW